MAEVRNEMVFPNGGVVSAPEPRTKVDTDMEDNSDLPESIVDGSPRTRKRGLLRRIGDRVFSGDRNTVKDYIIFDVLLPAFKDTVSDMVTNGIDILLNGSPSGRRNTRSRRPYGGRTDYRSASMSRVRNLAEKRASEAYYEVENGMDFDDILMLKTKAQDVLAWMRDRAADCNYVTLREYYSLSGHDYDWTMRRWGWDADDLYHVHPRRGGRDEDGTELWYLPLPKLRRLED